VTIPPITYFFDILYQTS